MLSKKKWFKLFTNMLKLLFLYIKVNAISPSKTLNYFICLVKFVTKSFIPNSFFPFVISVPFNFSKLFISFSFSLSAVMICFTFFLRQELDLNVWPVEMGHVQLEAGTTFDNSFFDNSFGFLRQFKNGSFLDPVFVHVTGRSQN